MDLKEAMIFEQYLKDEEEKIKKITNYNQSQFIAENELKILEKYQLILPVAIQSLFVYTIMKEQMMKEQMKEKKKNEDNSNN